MKTVDFSETIEACDLKVGRYKQLNDFMKVCEYHTCDTSQKTNREILFSK